MGQRWAREMEEERTDKRAWVRRREREKKKKEERNIISIGGRIKYNFLL